MTHNKNLNVKRFFTAVCALALTLSILFFVQFNEYVSISYEMEKCEEKIKQLSQENENLEIKFMEANHISNIETIVQDLEFVKAEKVHYIQLVSGVVATK